MKSTAYSFIAAIVIQIILQFAFIANFHGKFKVFCGQFSDYKYIAPDIASGFKSNWWLEFWTWDFQSRLDPVRPFTKFKLNGTSKY